jgi:hypothetical protein
MRNLSPDVRDRFRARQARRSLRLVLAPGVRGVVPEQVRGGGAPSGASTDLVESRRVQLIKAIRSGRRSATFNSDDNHSKLISCYWEKDEEPDDWHDFCLSLQEAAKSSGFPRKNAQELVAATRELVSNIFDHSEAQNSGIAGFAATSNELEIIIADRGIGVLRSLRTSSEFHWLRDSGEALRAALTDGTSRYGPSSGHGGGFRSLFRGLFNLSSALRFRSGDHALAINGISPGLGQARLSQKVQLPGFVICISCSR